MFKIKKALVSTNTKIYRTEIETIQLDGFFVVDSRKIDPQFRFSL